MNFKNPSEFTEGSRDFQSLYAPKNLRLTLASFKLSKSRYCEMHCILVGTENLYGNI